jgi:hypothetical protein
MGLDRGFSMSPVNITFAPVSTIAEFLFQISGTACLLERIWQRHDSSLRSPRGVYM